MKKYILLLIIPFLFSCEENQDEDSLNINIDTSDAVLIHHEILIENSSNFGEFLTNASNTISMIGEAKEGDKTMLDALIPAAKASLNDPKNSLEEASLAAKEGAKKTVTMPAKKGRAKYVENAGIGHMDPGAFSTSEIISFVCNYIRIENEKTL